MMCGLNEDDVMFSGYKLNDLILVCHGYLCQSVLLMLGMLIKCCL